MTSDRNGLTPTRGLRPVLGPAANALELGWLTGSSEDRAQIELVTELARRRLAPNGLPLLHPPAGSQADGQVRLGRVVHGSAELGWVGLHPDQLTHHLLCVGRSGSGKSTLLVRALLQLSGSGYPFIAFDHKRSLRALLAMDHLLPIHVVAQGRDLRAALRFNPLCPPEGVTADTHLRQLVDLIASSWVTGDGVRALLLRGMTACRERLGDEATLVDVRRHLEAQSLGSRESLWRVGAARVLEQLTTGPLGRIFNTRRGTASLDALLTHRTIIEMDGLSVQDGAFFINVLLRYLVCALQQSPVREKLRLAVAIDEAHHLLARSERATESEAERVMREGREVGLGCLLCTQSFANLSPVAIANTGTLVVMSCRHKADIQAAAQGLLLQDHQRELLALLPVGEAVVRLASRWLRPVHLRVPPLAMPKGRVRDWDVTLAFLEGPYAEVGAVPAVAGDSGVSADPRVNTPPTADRPGVPEVPRPDTSVITLGITAAQTLSPSDRTPSDSDDLLDSQPEAAVLLRNIAAHPLLGVAARYAACGLSRRKGDALKTALVQHGYLVPVSLPVPEGKVLLLGLTDAAQTWLRRHRAHVAPVHGSLEHAYWQQRVADVLARHGWEPRLEVTLDGHAFDVEATRAGQRLLVEVETGKSRWLGNLAALSGLEADHRAVLWLDPASLSRARLAAPSSVVILRPRELRAWIASGRVR